VQLVARDLVGCTLHHRGVGGRIVETESYHQDEPACHAYVGRTERTQTLFGPPGRAYVYRSYGIHALLNAVAEDEGIGAAVLIRALEPFDGIDEMRERRRVERITELCSGPGKLTEALAIGLELGGSSLCGGPVQIHPRSSTERPATVVTGERIGITKAAALPWRFCDAESACISRPWPAALRPAQRARRAATPV